MGADHRPKLHAPGTIIDQIYGFSIPIWAYFMFASPSGGVRSLAALFGAFFTIVQILRQKVRDREYTSLPLYTLKPGLSLEENEAISKEEYTRLTGGRLHLLPKWMRRR